MIAMPQAIAALYIPLWFKRYNLFHYFSLMNKSDFFTCILPDYVGHESIKEFLKNNHFENMKAGFLLRCQNSLRQSTPWNDVFSAMKFFFDQYNMLALDPNKI